MRNIIYLLITLIACKNNEQIKSTTKPNGIEIISETLQVKNEEKPEVLLPNIYSNKRFKDVTVEKVGQNSFLVRGKGQIFEANFNWIVEDGHEELKKGFQMTEAGAPEWGNFEFGIHVQKKRTNSTLTLIMFESSANDGSRQYELPIPLE